MGRKSKLNRNPMFYSESDYKFDTEIGMDYIEQDINQTLLLFRIDREKSTIVDIYGEAVDNVSVSYKEPIEINVILLLEQTKNKTYDKTQNLARYAQIGNLKFGVYEKTLKDNEIDISYGDYVGLQVTADQMEYFEVTNDGRINFDNKHSMFGYKPFYRTIECVSVDKNVFNGI